MLVAALTSGCESRPPLAVAAMVPQTSNGDFGYSEKSLAPDLYVVTYVSPRLRATREAADDHGLGGEKQRVHDLALWRAAQLAIEKGFPAFLVQQESRDVNVTVPTVPAYPLYPPAPFFPGRYCGWDCDWPYGYWRYRYYDPYYAERYSRAHTTGRITVNLTVKMLKKPVPGALDAAETAERLRTAYASASFSLTRDGY
jgi:hypothetical protein